MPIPLRRQRGTDMEPHESAIEQIADSASSEGELEQPLRVRVSTATMAAVDELEALFRGQGYRHVTRSHLVRVAIERLLYDVRTGNDPSVQE